MLIGRQRPKRSPNATIECTGVNLMEECQRQPQSYSRIRCLIESCPEAIKYKDVDDKTPLHGACAQCTANPRVVEFLVQHYSNTSACEALYQKTKTDGMTPLHVACQYKASLEIIQYLVRQWNNSLKEKTKLGWLPLHLACAQRTPDDHVVKFLIESWPPSVRTTTANDRLALYFALAHQSPVSTIRLLIEKYPDSIKAKDLKGWTPLHVACAYSSFECLSFCMYQWTKGCQEKDTQGQIPIHILCYYKRPLIFVQCLTREWPHCLRERDNEGRLPLQAACLAGAPIDVVKYLIEQYPSSIWEIGGTPSDISHRALQKSWNDDRECFEDFLTFVQKIANSLSPPPSVPQTRSERTAPLAPPTPIASFENEDDRSLDFPACGDSSFDCMERGNSFSGVDYCATTKELYSNKIPIVLSGSNSSSVKKSDDYEGHGTVTLLGAGLHKACEAPQSLPVIQNLLKQCPEAIKHPAFNGFLPIHTACLNQAPVEILKVLVEAYTPCLQVPDGDGNLPLHLSCYSGSPLASIKYLVHRNPETIFAINHFEQTPLDKVKQPFYGKQDESVIRWLQKPVFQKNELFNEQSPTTIPPSTINMLHSSDGALDLNVSSANSSTRPRSGSLPNLSCNATQRDQPKLPTFSKPMGVEETRAAIEELRKASRASLESHELTHEVVLQDNLLDDHCEDNHHETESREDDHNSLYLSVLNRDKENNADTPFPPSLRRQLNIMNPGTVPPAQALQHSCLFEENSMTALAGKSITDVLEETSAETTLVSIINDDSIQTASASSLSKYSSFYRSAVATAAADSPLPITRKLAPNTSSRLNANLRSDEQNDEIVNECATTSKLSPRQPQGSHHQHNVSLDSAVLSLLQIPSRVAIVDDNLEQQEVKRPGIVMVNEPAIHPNSVLYRAAYGTTTQNQSGPTRTTAGSVTTTNRGEGRAYSYATTSAAGRSIASPRSTIAPMVGRRGGNQTRTTTHHHPTQHSQTFI